MNTTKTLLLFCCLFTSMSGSAQALVSADTIAVFDDFAIELILGLIDAPEDFNNEYEVLAMKIVYETTDVNGEPTIASGAIAIPMNHRMCFAYGKL